MPMDYAAQVRALIEAGHAFYSRGWVPATSGNFSARVDDERVTITVSGRHKGKLTPDDIMLVDMAGYSLTAGRKPSAETALHLSLYRRDPSTQAVLHTHSPLATTLSLLLKEALCLRDYEVLKAFPGVDTHEYEVVVPIFANDQDIGRLAVTVEHYLDYHLDNYGYLIAGHGFYTWGSSVEDACRHVEAFEFLFECEMLKRRMTQ